VSKKKNQEEAVQRAQKYVSGDKLQKSEVKKLESKGFNSRQVRAVADSMKAVSDKAQRRIDSYGSSWVQTMGGTHRARVNAQGQVIASKGPSPSYAGLSGHEKSHNAYLTSKAAKKINNKVSKIEGGSLVGGEGMAVSRYVTVTDPGRQLGRVGNYATAGGGKHQLAIYAPVAQAQEKADSGKKDPHTKDPRTRYPITVDGATGNYATVDRLRQEAPEAPNYSPTGSGGSGSGAGPNSIYWNPFSYSDRLGDHNRQTAQWLSGIGAAARRESDAYLQNFARALPKAPDPNEANESVLSFLEQANERLGFG
jgi:hypothetical protein